MEHQKENVKVTVEISLEFRARIRKLQQEAEGQRENIKLTMRIRMLEQEKDGYSVNQKVTVRIRSLQ